MRMKRTWKLLHKKTLLMPKTAFYEFVVPIGWKVCRKRTYVKCFSKKDFREKELKNSHTTSEHRTSWRRFLYLLTTYSRRGWFIAIGYQISFRGRSLTRVRLLDHVLCSNVEYLVKTLTHSRVGGRVCARYHSSRTLSRTSSTATTLLCSWQKGLKNSRVS